MTMGKSLLEYKKISIANFLDEQRLKRLSIPKEKTSRGIYKQYGFIPSCVNLINASRENEYPFNLSVTPNNFRIKYAVSCLLIMESQFKQAVKNISSTAECAQLTDMSMTDFYKMSDIIDDKICNIQGLIKQYTALKTKDRSCIINLIRQMDKTKVVDDWTRYHYSDSTKINITTPVEFPLEIFCEDYETFIEVFDMFDEVQHIGLPLNENQIKIHELDNKIKVRHKLNGLRYRVQVKPSVPYDFIMSLRNQGKVECKKSYTLYSIQLESKDQVMMLKMAYGEMFIKASVNATYKEMDDDNMSAEDFLETYSWK